MSLTALLKPAVRAALKGTKSVIALHYCTAISRDVRLKQLTHRLVKSISIESTSATNVRKKTTAFVKCIRNDLKGTSNVGPNACCLLFDSCLHLTNHSKYRLCATSANGCARFLDNII